MKNQARHFVYKLPNLLNLLVFCILIFYQIVVVAVTLPADFNADGYADLAVGVPSEDLGSITDAGAVHVFYGSSVGIQSNNQIWHLNSPGVLLDANTGDRLGSALATGDFNQDTYADLAIGIPFKDNKMGQVIVLYGSSVGLSAAGNQVWNQGNLADKREKGDQFGSALTTGDFNADGYSDLAIGVPKEDFPDKGIFGPKCGICPDAGVVNLVYGSSTGLSAFRNELWHQDRGDDLDGWDNWVEWQDCFGAALNAGDFDGNGADDLAIGEVCEQTGGAGEGGLNNGAVNVYYGVPGVGLSISGAVYLRQWFPDILGWPDTHDAFGYSLAVGDFNRDGLSDLAIGVPGEEVDCASVTDSGAVAVFYGKLNRGLVLNNASLNELWCRNTSGILGNGTGRWGSALAAGDFNADGFDDVAIGAPLDNIDGVQGAGSISVLYGSASRLSNSGNQLFSQNSSGIVDTAQAGDWYGHSLTAADFNGDGVQDLAVGIPFENIGINVNAGAVNLIYGMRGVGLSINANRLLYQDSVGIVDQSEFGDEFGGRLLPQLYKSPWPNQPSNDGGGGGGPLSGTVAIAPPTVNLTSTGSSDWVHWGRIDATLVDRKTGVTPQISQYTPLAGANPSASKAISSAYSWNDGTPTSVVPNSKTGLWLFRVDKGFEFTVPADTTPRTLKVYVGAKNASGLFVASLSDGSASDYSTFINQPSGKTSRVISLDYQAASVDQVLTIRYTVNALYLADFKSWIALESATLQGGGVDVNQSPVISVIDTKIITEGQLLTIPVSATDNDGPAPLILSETNTLPGNPNILTDFGGGSGQLNWTPLLGDATGSPYSVTVMATDGNGAANNVTFSVLVTPSGGGGSVLTGNTAIAASNINLTSEGIMDWIHWGRINASTVERKAGVTPKISNYLKIGGANPSPTIRVKSAYSWNDGTPVGSVSNSNSGLWLFRAGKGFEFTVPADAALRTLKVYVGVNNARGLLEASLSDAGVPAYSTFIDQPVGNSSHVVMLNYQAASVGQQLTVRYTVNTLYLSEFKSWVTLESAALQ